MNETPDRALGGDAALFALKETPCFFCFVFFVVFFTVPSTCYFLLCNDGRQGRVVRYRCLVLSRGVGRAIYCVAYGWRGDVTVGKSRRFMDASLSRSLSTCEEERVNGIGERLRERPAGYSPLASPRFSSFSGRARNLRGVLFRKDSREFRTFGRLGERKMMSSDRGR